MPELVWVDRNAFDPGQLVEKMESLGINPCSLAVAIRVKSVEANLHPFEQGNAFNVVNGDAVLEREARVIRPQRKAAVGGQSPQKHLDSSAGAGFMDLGRIAARGAVKLAIANGDRFTAQVQNLASLVRLQLAYWQGW